MAGRETTGVGAATADLFAGRPWLVVAGEAIAPIHLTRVRALATATGARPIEMTAIDHDLAVAAISHLPLIAAAALVESVAGDPARSEISRPLAASGWRDMTRLARGDEVMGADIIATNAGPIAAQLRAYRDAIDAWLRELESMIDGAAPAEPDPAAVTRLRVRLEAARADLERQPAP
jgi:prephenate dehydrogenase